MDGSPAISQPQQVDVEAHLRTIKQRMPKVYGEIQRRAAERGREVYGQVRRAIAGQPDAFYAMEAGHVVGTPFARQKITDEVAALMVQFNVGFVVLWGEAA